MVADRQTVAARSVADVRVNRLLVVEDDLPLGTALVAALEANGYLVQWSQTAAAALAAFGGVDLVVLDLGLPDADGIEVCRRVHAADASMPVIILTARESDVDVVVGLDAGAMDYVRKPFALDELLARIRVHLRHVDGSSEPVVEVNGVRADPSSRRVWVNGTETELRAKEFDLLFLLMSEAGRALPRDRLMREVWDEHWSGSTKTLDVTMASLRRKLGEAAGHTSRITALRNVGYRFERS